MMKALCFLLFFLSAGARADVSFVAIGNPGFLQIEGRGGVVKPEIKNQPDGSISGVFVCDLSRLKTGLSLRDKHMHEKYLQTNKYPNAILFIDKLKVQRGVDMLWEGKLTIKNETKPVSGRAVVSADNKVTARFNINLDDYPSIGVPSYMGVSVAKVVEIKVEF